MTQQTTNARRPSRQPQRRAALVAWIALMASGCPFGPALPVAEDPNYPPFIDPEDVSPRTLALTVRRSEVLTLEVSRFLDPNDEESLDVLLFLSDQPGNQLVNTVVARDLSVTEPIDDVFLAYEGYRLELDPCDVRWADRPEQSFTLLVSDGDIFFEQGEYTTVEGRYFDTYTWTVAFDGECL